MERFYHHFSFGCVEWIINYYLCLIAVTALRAIKGSLIDPNKNLSNWNRGDPCTANWTGVICFNSSLDDGYLHVEELYDFHSWFINFVRNS